MKKILLIGLFSLSSVLFSSCSPEEVARMESPLSLEELVLINLPALTERVIMVVPRQLNLSEPELILAPSAKMGQALQELGYQIAFTTAEEHDLVAAWEDVFSGGVVCGSAASAAIKVQEITGKGGCAQVRKAGEEYCVKEIEYVK